MTQHGGRSEAAFRSLYERSHLQVLSYCLRRTPDRDSALDAASETFVVAWRRFADLPAEDGDALVWLFAVARRVLANQRRSEESRSRTRDRLASLADTATDSSEQSLVDAEERQQVLRALRRLSSDDQELLRLDTWEELSGRQLALHLGCSENAVNVRLHRARKRLAKAYDRERSRHRISRRAVRGGDAG